MQKTYLSFLLLLLGVNAAYSQSSFHSENLFKICELWGLIKYFHPDQPGQAFDSAFVAEVPQILQAKHQHEIATITSRWLSVLQDHNTRIATQEGISSESVLKAEFDTDSVLIITMHGTSLLEDFNQVFAFIENAQELIRTSRHGIIFDLRQYVPVPQQYEGYLGYYFDELNASLATDQVPFFRRKYYSGFKPEHGSTSGSYTVNDIMQQAIQPGNFGKNNERAVWIVDAYSKLPMAALSQQATGAGIIIKDRAGHIPDMIPTFTRYFISDSVSVDFKTSDIVMPDGQAPHHDIMYSDGTNPLQMAKQHFLHPVHPKNSSATVSVFRATESMSYPEESYPSVGYRVLAAAKIFTVIEHFFPYTQFMDKNWRSVCEASLLEFIKATDEIEYGKAVAKLYAHINDSHGYLRGNKAIANMNGEAPSPVMVDWIENKVVVTALRNEAACREVSISVGDIITEVNGVDVTSLMKPFEIYIAHSTKPALWQRAARAIMRGPNQQTGNFTVQDHSGKKRNIQMMWSTEYNQTYTPTFRYDTLELLDANTGYADLTRMPAAMTDAMFEKFKDTRAIIFDMRGYPMGTAWSIAPRLTEQKNVPLALFRKPEVLGPNLKSGDILSNKTFTEFYQSVASSDQWKYKGKTLMLIDHQAMSQAEHTGLFFEGVNNTVFIGSPTVGANGDVTNFEIPGGIILSFSGQGVWHADGRQLQRVGLQPHVHVTPTVKGIREDRDEVLEAAMNFLMKEGKRE